MSAFRSHSATNAIDDARAHNETIIALAVDGARAFQQNDHN